MQDHGSASDREKLSMLTTAQSATCDLFFCVGEFFKIAEMLIGSMVAVTITDARAVSSK